MDNSRGRALTPEEEKEMREGLALLEMVQSNEGWRIVNQWYQDMAYHTWIDPREVTNKTEWEWRELNAFHASNNAKEVTERITKAISRAEYLQKVKNGEIDQRKFRL